jgi:hypothetical protein
MENNVCSGFISFHGFGCWFFRKSMIHPVSCRIYTLKSYCFEKIKQPHLFLKFIYLRQHFISCYNFFPQKLLFQNRIQIRILTSEFSDPIGSRSLGPNPYQQVLIPEYWDLTNHPPPHPHFLAPLWGRVSPKRLGRWPPPSPHEFLAFTL